MSSQLKPAIWPCNTGQQIPWIDRCQSSIAWISNIKEVHGKPRLQVPYIWCLAAMLPWLRCRCCRRRRRRAYSAIKYRLYRSHRSHVFRTLSRYKSANFAFLFLYININLWLKPFLRCICNFCLYKPLALKLETCTVKIEKWFQSFTLVMNLY